MSLAPRAKCETEIYKKKARPIVIFIFEQKNYIQQELKAGHSHFLMVTRASQHQPQYSHMSFAKSFSTRI